MLSERTRNTFVGLTIILALAGLMLGIFMLGRLPSFSTVRPYQVVFVTPNANGVGGGARVEFNGVQVGLVDHVRLSGDLRTAEVVASIDRHVDIPRNVLAAIIKPPTIGNAYISLSLPESDAATAVVETRPGAGYEDPKAALPKDGGARVVAIPADQGLIPEDIIVTFRTAGTEIQKLARSLNAMVGDEQTQKNFRDAIANVAAATDNLNKVLSDPSIKDTLKNVNVASADMRDVLRELKTTVAKANTSIDSIGGAATQASDTLKTTQSEIVKVSEKLIDTLDRIETTAQAITEGKGTTGRLVNDPRLYEGLVDLSKSLKSTTDDLNVLIRKWQDEGVKFQLK